MTASVFSPHRFARLLQADATNISRDPTLIFAIIMSLAPALLVYFFQTKINHSAQDAFGVENIVAKILPLVLCLPAFLVGWVTGFLFLEDRDEGTLIALDITPIGKSGFIAYRTTVTALITIIVTLIGCALLLPEKGWPFALLISVLIASEAVAAAFILPAVARNKVEGLALTKLTNIASMIPLLALFSAPWRFVGGIVPTYWIGELLEISPTRYLDFPLVAFLAIASHAIVTWYLYRLISSRIG